MLEGLEISIIKYSDVKENKEYLRYDAEYYSKKVLNLLQKIYSQPHEIIKDGYDVSKLAGFEFTKYFTPANMQSSKHYIALTSKNIQNELLSLEDFITIDKTIADDNLQRSKIEYEDVILSYTGEYRRSLVMLDKDVKYQLGPNICRIRPQYTEINPYYLSTFLNSKLGQMLLDREKTLTAQPTVAMGRIRKMIIPIIQQNIQEQIAENIKVAHSKRQQAGLLYKDAIRLLDNFISIPSYSPIIPTTAEKSLCESFIKTGRIDAEYYQPKYDFLFAELQKFECKKMYELVDINKSIEPGSDEYSDNGIPFVRVSDYSEYGITSPSIYLDRHKFAKTIRPQKDTILLSKDGSVGIAYQVRKNLDVITSGAILHLNIISNNILPEYLTLVLNSSIVKQQAERDAGGSIIQHWKSSEIEQVLIPILPMPIQQQIADLIRESFALRDEANQLLAEAKQLVETTIENM